MVKKIDDVIPIIMFTSKISLDVWLFVGKDELIECHYLDHTIQLIDRLVSSSFRAFQFLEGRLVSTEFFFSSNCLPVAIFLNL